MCEVVGFKKSDREFHTGAITRVAMHNFLTYADVNFKPGPKLNIVMGPNGAGKSSIVCAMVLGLAGNPKFLGRSENLNDFIMHEQQHAWVEVELEVHEVGKRVVFRRSFERNVKGSKWQLDGRTHPEKHVKEKIAALGIQVDNLCTFLPQDRVGDFSGYNPQEIMVETCKAVAERELYKPYMELTEMSKMVGSRASEQLQLGVDLQQARHTCDMLRADVERMREREQLVERLNHLRWRKMWLTVQNMHAQLVKDKAATTAIKAELAEATQADAPLKAAVQAAREGTECCAAALRAKEREQAGLSEKRDALVTEAQKLQERFVNLELRVKGVEEKRRKKEAQKVKVEGQIAEAQRELAIAKDRAQATQQDREAACKEMDELIDEMEALHEKQRGVQGEARQAAVAVRSATAALADASQDNSRFRHHAKAAEFVKVRNWIKDNHARFKGEVYGPIAMEVSVNDQDMLRCLETHVRFDVWTAFVTTNWDDRQTLHGYISSVRSNVSFSIFNCEGGGLRDINGQQPFTGNGLTALQQQAGPLSYLDDAFTAPDAVRQMLRDHAGVHTVLVGGEQLEAALLAGPQIKERLVRGENGRGMSCAFFTVKPGAAARNGGAWSRIEAYNVKVSRYDGQVTSFTRDVNMPPNLVGGGVDQEAKNRAQAQLERAQQAQQRAEERARGTQDELQKVRERRDAADARRKNALTAVKHLATLQGRVPTLQKKLDLAIKELKANSDKERADTVRQLLNCLTMQTDVARKQQGVLAMTIKAHAQILVAKVVLKESKSAEDAAKLKLQGAEQRTQDIKERLRRAQAKYTNTRDTMSDLKKKAKAECEIWENEAEGISVPMYDVLAQYPDNVDIVEEEINTCEEKINNCVDNPEVINRYNAGLARITELEQRLEILNDSNEEEARKVAAVRNPFVTRLEHTINELNKRFSTYMEQMGCGGEVELLNKGDTYGDYGKWGIAIKVRFRNRTDEDMLKILDKEIHSGGERSVSTILYLMAMQDLQSSPFRVVDEVNQGMDAHNERLVFSRIVRNSCRADCKQFFLITPKLLQGLIAMDNPFVTVHFILNGPHALNGQHPFSMRDLVQLMRSKRAAAGEGGGGTRGGGGGAAARRSARAWREAALGLQP